MIRTLFIDGETEGKGGVGWGCHGGPEVGTSSLSQDFLPSPHLGAPWGPLPPSLQPSSTIVHTSSVWPSGWNYSPLIELKTRGAGVLWGTGGQGGRK